MKATVEKGDLKIDVMSLVEALDADTRKVVAQFLVADEYLFRAVLECVAGDGSYFTDDTDGHWWFDRRTVLELRERLLPLMNDIARKSVEEALRQRDDAKADAERHKKWAWQMYRAWPDSHWRERPELPRFGSDGGGE